MLRCPKKYVREFKHYCRFLDSTTPKVKQHVSKFIKLNKYLFYDLKILIIFIVYFPPPISRNLLNGSNYWSVGTKIFMKTPYIAYIVGRWILALSQVCQKF